MEKELKILFLDTRPLRRGAQLFVHELKHRFSLDGFSVRRIFLYEENNYEQLPLDEHDLVLPFRDSHIFEKFPTIQPKLVKALAREIQMFAPEVILCNGSRTLKYAAAVKKCYPSINAKWVYRVIDSAKYWNNRSTTQFYYKYCIIPSMDGAVGVSHKSLDEMIQYYGFNKPSVCIPRAIDVDYFANFQPEEGAREKIGIPNNAFVLLFLGNFTRQKRPDRFIEIIHGLQKVLPHVHGLMVGDGPLKNDSVKQIEKLGLYGKITLGGYQKDVRPWISMSDILLLTSDTEGMPGVVLEAGAMKKSTISNDVGGVREIILDQTNGFIVSNWEVNKFISFIKLLSEDNGLKTNVENNIFNSVHFRNNINSIFVAYKHFLNEIINGI
jgi:glycosyltransferase involved in cell wall biosynthesis